MRIVVVADEKNYRALRSRLLGGAGGAHRGARGLEQAVRDANPHADLDELAPGTVLVVPDLEEAADAGTAGATLSLGGSATEVVDTLVRLAGQAADSLGAAAADQEKSDAADRRRLLRVLDSGLDVGKDRALPAYLQTVRAGIDGEAEAAKQRRAVLARSQKEWAGELEKLRASVAPRGALS